MKELVPVAWDDIDLLDGKKTPAAHTALLGWGTEDGKDWTVVEVDLTDDRFLYLRGQVQPYLKAGHKPHEVPQSRGARSAGQGKKAYTHDPDRVEYLRRLREWADEHGLSYRTSTGKYYYSPYLQEAYQAYCDGKPEAEWHTIYDRRRTNKAGG